MIERTLSTGYPFIPRTQTVGNDALGIEVLTGDEILVYKDEFFLVKTMGLEAIEVLELLGATYEISK